MKTAMMRIALFTLLAVFLTGCDVAKERMGIKDPAKVEAEAKATGASCRLSGRSLEDCYRLNERQPRASIYDGWKEMNEYMVQRNMQVMPPSSAAPASMDTGHETGEKAGMVESAQDGKPKDIRPKLPDLAKEAAKAKH